VTVLSALVFWGSLWGVTGMLLAAPMTAVLRIALEEVDITAPIAHLMAGRSMLDADPDGDSGDSDGGD
jgi:AI-2 transport protein TqsA